MKRGLICLLFVFLFQFSGVMAQPCPPDSNCDAWGDTLWIRLGLGEPDCDVWVFYLKRFCNGSNVPEFFITSISVEEECESLPGLSLYENNLNVGLEFAISSFVERVSERGSFPPCGFADDTFPEPSDTTMSVRIYSASCGIWVHCTYEVDPDSRECDPGFDLPYPEEGENPTTVTVAKWQACGNTCCRRTYQYCWQDDLTFGDRFVRMRLLSKERITDCSEQSEYDRDCQDGC